MEFRRMLFRSNEAQQPIKPLSSLGFVLIQLKSLVQGAHCQFHVFVVDDDRGLDLAGADHLDIDALFRQGAEHQTGHAHVAAHAYANNGYFTDFVIGHDFAGTHSWADLVVRSEEHTSELQSLMSSSYAVFCMKKNRNASTY